LVNGYQCDCSDGYSGSRCEVNGDTPVDPCNPNPCQNDGTCMNAGDYFVCSCQAGYNGISCERNIDDCASNPCANAGTCTDQVDGFSCACPTGFSGPTCNNEPPTCPSENPCQHGQCVDGINGYKCDCDDGFIGATCQVNVDDCAPDPCDHGTCDDGDNKYTCTCEPGYEGPRCQEEHCAMIGVCGNGMCTGQGGCTCDNGWEGADCRDDIDECAAANPCLNGGTCSNTDGGFSCACATGYTGMLCDECADGYQDNDADTICCQNGYQGADCDECEVGFGRVNGSCQRTCESAPKACEHGICDHAGGDTVCICEADYFGPLCDSLVGTCSEGICGENGACTLTSSNTFKCDCDPTYTGRNCETLDDCSVAVAMGTTPCQHDGTCVDGDNAYTCTCTPGWTGDDCSEIDECEVALEMNVMPCNGRGACVDGDGAYTCTCDAGWLGDTCSEWDNCVGNQCLNGGQCVDGTGTYTCDCTGLDYNGQFCESEIDNCAVNPCLHGGSCTDVGAGFQCDCARTGYTGTTCQDDFDECADAQADVCGSGTCVNVATGYTCQCPDGTLDVSGDGTNCAAVVSVFAGTVNTCAISAAGSLHCWGDNVYGQLAQGYGSNPSSGEIRTPKRVGTGTNWSKVSVGGRHVCGLRNGHLYCWGANSNLQSGGASAIGRTSPFEIRPDLTWTDVSVGDSHSCALAGTALYCWGNSSDGQAGAATAGTNVDAPKQITGTWSKLSAGAFHTCAINTANELRCWGRNAENQAGTTQPIALPANADGSWSSVAAGPMHTCAVAGTRTYCWGQGTEGALGNGASTDQPIPQQVTFAQALGSLQTGEDFSCGATAALDAGSDFEVYCWGTNDYSLLLTGGGNVNTPQLLTTSNTPLWEDFAVGTQHMCGVVNGLVFCWGNNADGAVGNAAPGVALVTAPARVKAALTTHSGSDFCSPNPCRNGGTCTSTASGATCDCTGTGFGGANCTSTSDECTTTPTICGDGTCRDLLDDDGYSCTCPDGLIDVNQTGRVCEKVGTLAAGVNHSCVLTETSRTLHCWGSNRYGQFGLGAVGTTDYYPNENSQTYRTPLRLRTVSGVTGDVSGWTHLVVGENITCGTLPNGSAESLYCWGDNSLGAVGVGTITVAGYPPPPAAQVPTTATVAPLFHAAPVLLDATRTWVSLATSYATTCGVDSTGNLYCWGLNKYGQAGNGSLGNPQIPNGAYSFVPIMYSHATAVPQPTGETWVSVAPGNTTTCARTNMNNVYCWGRRNLGQTGTGGANNQPDLLTPTKVNRPDPQGFTAVWADITHACGLVGTSAFCWGQGTSGGIGNGANLTQSSPTAVSGGYTFSSLTLGSNFACGLIPVPATTPQAYTARCWGNSTKGILLNDVSPPPSPNPVNTPTLINTARQWELLDLGPTHACGVDYSDDKLYCWGDNGLEGTSGTGKIGSVPASQVGNIGLVGPVKAAAVLHPAP
jgi:Notch-like protein